MKKLVLLAGLAAALTASTQAQNFTANLTIDQEPPPLGTRSGSGSGTFTLSGNSVSYTITYSGLSTPSTVAHIHGPTIAQPNMVNGTFQVVHGFTFANNTQAGTITGTWTGMTAQNVADFNAGLMYANIHSSGFPGGEIRGQIVAVPEPSTYALLAGATLGGLALRRRKMA